MYCNNFGLKKWTVVHFVHSSHQITNWLNFGKWFNFIESEFSWYIQRYLFQIFFLQYFTFDSQYWACGWNILVTNTHQHSILAKLMISLHLRSTMLITRTKTIETPCYSQLFLTILMTFSLVSTSSVAWLDEVLSPWQPTKNSNTSIYGSPTTNDPTGLMIKKTSAKKSINIYIYIYIYIYVSNINCHK